MSARESPSAKASANRFWLPVTALYGAITVLATWPVARDIGSALPGGGGDTYTGVWSLWYCHRALWRGDADFGGTSLLFFPIGTSLTFHVLDLGGAIIAEPLHWVGLSMPAIFSLVWLLSFPLSGLGAAYLAFVATGSRAGAIVAGATFMLCPFRTAHGLGQIELLGTQWMPLGAALLLHAFPGRAMPLAGVGRRTFLAFLAGMASAVSLLCSFYLGAFFGLFLLLYLSWRAAEGSEGRRIAPLLAFLCGAVLLGLPIALPFVRAVASGQAHYHMDTEARYPADLLGLLIPTYLNPLLGPLNRALTHGAKVLSGRPVEGTVGHGYLALLLAALGWRRVERLWKVALAAFFVLSLGMSLHVAGRDLHVPLPYVLLTHVPVLRGARAPSRFVIMVSLCLVPLVAEGAARLARRFGPRIAAMLLALALLELAAVPYPTRACAIPAAVVAMAEDPAPGSVLTLPDFQSQQATFFQTIHHRPLAGGFVSRPHPDVMRDMWAMIRAAIAADRAPAETRAGLAALHARYVVVEEDVLRPLVGARPWSTLERRLDAALGPPAWRDSHLAVWRVPRGVAAP